MLIGILSVTHGLLHPEATERLSGVDHIIHAVDIGCPDIVPRLREIAATTTIHGNADNHHPRQRRQAGLGGGVPRARNHHPREPDASRPSQFPGLLDLDPAQDSIAMVVSGHSHRPKIESANGVLFLIPGNAGRGQLKLPVTLTKVQMTENAVQPEIHNLVG